MKQEFSAPTVEEAKALAAQEFGVSEDKINFTVIEEPKKSLFGKVKGDARVEAEYTETKTDITVKYIRKVLTGMGVENITIDVTEIENGISLEINGDGFDEMIGAKGELLDSLQYLASLVCNKVDREYFRITTDSKGFRERRKKQLEELAAKIANNVKRSGRSSALEPMNPYERRIIHAAVSEIEGVTSQSKGEDPYRKVIISSTNPRRGGRDFKRGGKGGNRRNGGGRKGGRRPQSTGFDFTTSFEKEYKKPKPEDSMLGSGLYSKIDI
ncbi:RNA-binding cell elongation regulator Jag/EloR [Ruminococcus albus]|uniref:RNA-binding protein KhpB n=1 Tax=Ruminococcus albus TaxID=1264 RepID=A0A1H7GCS6_RUMAL|nr:RNA-binding cell elongation regulator Jag/EloR [Ruminococcus albus]SEK34300.1 spoIIIJ-associated protein [Ruminococcus albus]